MTLIPTPEQAAIVDAFRTGENLVVEAAAGTGKTSTLRQIADAAPGKSGLYLAFNKAIQTEAERKFANTGVTPKTAHSLAYAAFGLPMRHKLERGSRMRAADRADILGIRAKLGAADAHGNVTTVQRHVVVRLVLDTVVQFCRSSDFEVGIQHAIIPDTLGLDEVQKQDLAGQLVTFARRYWADAINPNGTLPYVHDFYLKQWAMTGPKLDVDYILFDEAQDSDPLISSIVKAQTHAQIVAVGDANQAIYGWRGAIDSMSEFGGERFQLTQSFRFGEAIADEANQWLEYLDANLRVRGSDKPSSVHTTLKRMPEAVLTRTNAGAIGEVIGMLRRAEGNTVGIGGKGKAKQLRDLAEAAKTLIDQGWTRHPELDMFKSWAEIQAYVEEEEDAELKPLVDLVDSYGADYLIRAIDSTVDPMRARTVVSTVHVAKGLEWSHVRIADDFRVPGWDDETGQPNILEKADAMLAYVAVTRAQRHLDAGGLGWIRPYRRFLVRPEMGLEWRRRFYAERKEFATDQDTRAVAA